MALLTIQSSNPNLSFILAKNPASGLLIKSHRRGLLYGWFPPNNSQVYCIWFKDSDTEVSFKDDVDASFEYLDISRYNSPLFPMGAITEILASASKKHHENDSFGFNHEVVINLMYLKNPKYLEIFKVKDYKIESNEIAPNNYQVKISSSLPIYELLGFVNLFCMFNAIKNDLPIVIEDEFVKKYIACLNAIDAPYILRYVFKVNLLRNRARFAEQKAILEQSKSEDIKMTYGSTTIVREEYVKTNLGQYPNLSILDVGCGEGNYVRLLAKIIPEYTYYAVDKNNECIEEVKHLSIRKQLDNVKTFSSLEDSLKEINEEVVNVLLVEVLEHMSVEDAEILLKRVLTDVKNVNKVIITTPNHDFSKYFGAENGDVRHDDHHFEFTQNTFSEFLKRVVPEDKFSYQIEEIGDVVANISMGLACIIRKI